MWHIAACGQAGIDAGFEFDASANARGHNVNHAMFAPGDGIKIRRDA
jgi:hypothetical protein